MNRNWLVLIALFFLPSVAQADVVLDHLEPFVGQWSTDCACAEGLEKADVDNTSCTYRAFREYLLQDGKLLSRTAGYDKRKQKLYEYVLEVPVTETRPGFFREDKVPENGITGAYDHTLQEDGTQLVDYPLRPRRSAYTLERCSGLKWNGEVWSN
jgi:hypothetical protein